MKAPSYLSYRLYITKNADGNSGYFAISEWRMWEHMVDGPGDPGNLLTNPASISASATGSPYVPRNAIDGNAATTWETPSTAGAKWIRYDFTEPKTIRAIFLQHGTWVGEAPADFILQGSNDGTIWTDVHQETGFLTRANAQAGRLRNLASGFGGKAVLADGRPASRVLVYAWSSGELVTTLRPDPMDGSWTLLPDDVRAEMIIMATGPAGYRPLVHGPVRGESLW